MLQKVFAFCLSLYALFGGDGMAQDIISDLEVWYQFEYVGGDALLRDHSPNNRHLQPVKGNQPQPFSGAFEWQNEEIGGEMRPALYFPAGRDGDVFLSNAAGNDWLGLAANAPRTLGVWVRIDPAADDFTGQVLFAYGNDGQPGGRFELDLKGHSIEFENAANTAGNGWVNRSVANLGNDEFPQGQWFHLALVYDGVGDRQTGLKLYLNGRQRVLQPVSSTADFSISTVLDMAPVLGQYMQHMALADFRFYSRALSAIEVGLLCPELAEPVDVFSIAHLNELLQLAVNQGDSRVVIPPGRYTDPGGNHSFIYLQHAEDLEIIADGVTMVCGKRTRALELSDCKNIRLQGLTIDYDPLTFTQGDIVATGSGYVDVKIHKGYPLEPFSRIDIIDPATRYRKRGSIFVWEAKGALIADSIVRVSQPDLPAVATVGDMASMSGGADATGIVHTLVLSDCRGGMVLDNVTVHAGPGFGIFEAGGEGGTLLTHCKVVPGPKPEGAVQERLLSVSWDAIQHLVTRKGPTVEYCEVKDAGDDSWSVTWNGAYTLQSVSGTSITITPDNLQVGDSLRTSLTSEVVFVTAKVGNSLQLNRTCPWPVGTRLYSPSRRCEDFVLRNNHFHSTGRVLVKAGNGLIADNFFEDTHSGVTVNTEIMPSATGISDLVIRNNRIKGTGHFMPGTWSNQAGAISIADGSGSTLSPADAFSRILIQQNKFEDVSGVNIMISSAQDIQLVKNEFHQTGSSYYDITGRDYGINQNTVVYLKNCESVLLDSNAVIHSGLGSLLDTVQVTGFQKLRRGIFDTTVPFVFGVAITSPAGNVPIQVQQPVALASSATYSDGSIVRVGYYLDGQLLKEVLNAPYYLEWVPSRPGAYAITARAIAIDGTSVDSQPLKLRVEGEDQSVVDINPRNLFTPNGDGKNDYWEIERIDGYPDLEVRVYSRRGELLFNAAPYQPWYGMSNGGVLPSGVYFYTIKNQQKLIKSGSVTLIR